VSAKITVIGGSEIQNVLFILGAVRKRHPQSERGICPMRTFSGQGGRGSLDAVRCDYKSLKWIGRPTMVYPVATVISTYQNSPLPVGFENKIIKIPTTPAFLLRNP